MELVRRWPAEICHPRHIPDNIEQREHQVGQFPVRFLGSHDYNWLHMGRTYAYQEGDSSRKGASTTKKADKDFSVASDEAAEAHAAYKAVMAAHAEKETEHDSKKPAKYRYCLLYGPVSCLRQGIKG